MVGLTAVVVLVMWPVIAYQPEPAARAALVSDALVRVVKTDSAIGFFPTDTARAGGVGFLFFPETLVDPISYAPLARATAEAGFPTWIMPLSHRGVGGTDDPVLYTRAEALLRATGPAGGWVVGGHSHGAGVATRMAATGHGRIAGLVVIGGSDPKDIDLSPLLIPSAKIVGTRDGVASPDAVRESAMLSPVETVWTWVEGGNHSAFGWYGFQPGDHRATISAEEQRAVMIRAVVEALRRAEGWHG
ncbi:MAG: alpha/beta hydrolase [Gemmatimonadota bacterium]|nr:alpha/beta hydrolase [Gemmatimonadota bacterium]